MAEQKIKPCLWVAQDAKKAAGYCLSIFKSGKLVSYVAYKNAPHRSFDVAEIELLKLRFQILAAGPLFKFNESISFSILCKDQGEVDYYWDALSAKGGSEGPCGWVKDKYGLSWQIIPERYFDLAKSKNAAKRSYAMNALMKMKRIIIADLEEK